MNSTVLLTLNNHEKAERKWSILSLHKAQDRKCFKKLPINRTKMAEIHTFICKTFSTLPLGNFTLLFLAFPLFHIKGFYLFIIFILQGSRVYECRTSFQAMSSLSEVLAPKFYMIDRVGWEPGCKVKSSCRIQGEDRGGHMSAFS